MIKFGWQQPESMVSQLNNWYIDNVGADRQDIIDKAVELGMSEASAQYYVGVYKIVAEMADKLGLSNAA